MPYPQILGGGDTSNMHALIKVVSFCPAFTVADPGFPRGGDAKPKGGRKPIIWPIYPENCMKMKKFWARGGAHPLCPLDPPLLYTLEVVQDSHIYTKWLKLHSCGWVWEHKAWHPYVLVLGCNTLFPDTRPHALVPSCMGTRPCIHMHLCPYALAPSPGWGLTPLHPHVQTWGLVPSLPCSLMPRYEALYPCTLTQVQSLMPKESPGETYT